MSEYKVVIDDKENLETFEYIVDRTKTVDNINTATYKGEDEVEYEFTPSEYTELKRIDLKFTKPQNLNFLNSLPSNLEILNVGANDLYGQTIPAITTTHSSLKILRLYNNGLDGELPDISKFSNLEEFSLGGQRWGTWTDSQNGWNKVLKDRHSVSSHPGQFTLSTDFDVPSTLKTVLLKYNSMNTDTINGILIALDNAGASNGTLDIRGNQMATSTGTGTTAKGNLATKGWTILS